MRRVTFIVMYLYFWASTVAPQHLASIRPVGKNLVFETPEGNGAVLIDGCDIKAEIESMKV
jgi:hypothetical protein